MPGSWLQCALPNLNADNHELTSMPTPRYNCIAWAASNDTRWWWPTGRYYWPPNVTREESIEAFIRAYATVGYTRCDDGSLEPEFEKVAIYARSEAGVLTPTHAARQLPTGRWTSKLGPLEDIDHANPECVCGPVYGNVAVFLKRPRQK